MPDAKYSNSRPSIPAGLRRSVEVESGHRCAIKGCNEHTYLEIHHIDENRENNVLANLILLCDKHHKMAHAKVIDRKALREYKKLLNDSYNSQIDERFDRLEKLLQQQGSLEEGNLSSRISDSDFPDDKLRKESPKRADIMSFVLTHVAVRHFEKEVETPFEHQVIFTRGCNTLRLDALKQDDRLDQDFIIEVQYLRKSYNDASIYGRWLENKVELYELFTGRKAKGILLVIVGRDRMKEDGGLPLTRKGVSECNGKVELEVFSCADIGFHPGPVSLAMFQSYIKDKSAVDKKNSSNFKPSTDAEFLAMFMKYTEND
ncbi:HNH endonuclease signature motif containing protein [Microbulbifer sp. MKSA007]|nr:HNH endonuclease signature motif containing protein [Microbulbifer sp. MKSA007]